jgi:beta-xylosidase
MTLSRPLASLLALAAFALPLAAAPAPQYKNPILFADYSDPDVIRDGKNFYLVASTFHFSPGLPILQSQDLVHWKIITHAVKRLNMDPAYNLTGMSRYGKGIWAPALRKHNGRFYLYFPTPTEGIFMVSARKITGPWTEPVTVMAQPGLEDPCPFWDDDGQAYLIRSKTGAGPLFLHRMSPDGTKVLDDGKEIVRDPVNLKTLEGPKMYKRNGFYYIFAPFGGVSTGAQAVLRSKSIYGPYEHRTVLQQGDTAINGPHQGGYIETPDGKGWFIHFQSRGAHGRILHLEPVRWENDWPVMGEAAPGAEAGVPVAGGPIPVTLSKPSHDQPQTSDEFASSKLGLQWEWNHNPDDAHWSLTERKGFLRLHPTQADGLLLAHNTLTQQMQDENLDFTVRLDLAGMKDGTHTGLAMLEKSYSGLEVVQTGGVRQLNYLHLADTIPGPKLDGTSIELQVSVTDDTVQYAYRTGDAGAFTPLGPATPITFAWWKGSRPAVFAYSSEAASQGFVDVDWAHYTSK